MKVQSKKKCNLLFSSKFLLFKNSMDDEGLGRLFKYLSLHPKNGAVHLHTDESISLKEIKLQMPPA